MKKMNVIYNSEINIVDWVSSRKEMMEDKECCKYCKNKKNCVSCHNFYEVCDSYNTDTLGDEKANLNIKVDNEIVALVDVGRWNGRSNGYKFIGNNVANIFAISEDSNKYYCDAYNVRASLAHYDSTHFVLYRKLKSNVTKEKLESLLLKNNYKLTESQISMYTESLRPFVANVYGW